ncbi:alpha/beta fold hydrolase [Priestia megaterium]|uniref:alpha/beta fold hydrolase n=1 Tax=Priestia megaterium TaxID=1404 RepID=UPI000A4099ED|nr:alpha/beta hydrolase [Priestia megaterium]MCM3545424.1 alpha/beta hydrolase [Priestia megaterium]MEC1069360.1 alpha/beta hydrolase [Priestia megaterium]
MLKDGYVKVNDVNLHYVTKGEGELMLFLHGFPYFWYTWHHQLEEFSKDYRVVAVDMRGYNLSDKPEEISAYSMPLLMEDVKQLIEAFGEKECVLVAHDWGGAVAWAFAYTYPQYVKKLVMFDAPHPYTFIRELAENPAQREASSYMSFFQKPNSQDELLANNSEKLRNMVTEPGIKKGYLTKEEEAKYVEAWNQPNAMKSMLNYYRASSLYPFEERVHKPVALPHKVFHSPTLIVWGNADEAFENSNLDGIEEYVPNVKIHRLDGVGHAPQHEQPEKVNEFMRDFLRK